jgi:hypothetical protein
MVTIKVASSVQVMNGPQMSMAEALEVEAYEKIEFTLDKNTLSKTAAFPTSFSFLLIKSSLDDASDNDVKPTVQYNLGNLTGISLDAPLMLLGTGFSSKLGSNFSKVTFTLTPATGEPKPSGKVIDSVKVEILVGNNLPAGS